MYSFRDGVHATMCNEQTSSFQDCYLWCKINEHNIGWHKKAVLFLPVSKSLHDCWSGRNNNSQIFRFYCTSLVSVFLLEMCPEEIFTKSSESVNDFTIDFRIVVEDGSA